MCIKMQTAECAMLRECARILYIGAQPPYSYPRLLGVGSRSSKGSSIKAGP